jgi:putative toxin-antitoxin system antitoxin component (TIGR02293 family)
MTRTELEMDFALSALRWIELNLDLADVEIGRALGVDRTTIDRWRKRETPPTSEQRKRLPKFTQLKRFLENTFRTPELGRQWLRRAVPALHGRTPISVIADGEIDRVLGLLATHAAGVYV